jgi:hypothetical protein
MRAAEARTQVKREITEGSKSQVASIPLSEIVNKVKVLESSNGLNDGCKRYGKVNGYGYRQNSKEWICFNSESEVRGYVAELFEKRLKEMSLEESLCMYNQGIKTNNCDYSIKFKNI